MKITRYEREVLQAEVDELKAAIRAYLREISNPAPDYTMRRILREHLAELVDESIPGRP